MWVLNLEPSARSELLALPESGMGFQHVEALYQGRATQFLVLNGEWALELTSLELAEGSDPATIEANGAQVMTALRDVSRGYMASWKPSNFTILTSRVGALATRGSVPVIAPPSSLVKRYLLPSSRTFHRYSAFNPDRRVDARTGDWLPGTYATTESERAFVPTGFVAVGRFALPNKLPASHLYTIQAASGTDVSFGTVAPAFGQSGGGVEAFFIDAVVNVMSPRESPSMIADE